MKRSKSYVATRRNKLLAIVKQSPDITVGELAKLLGTSEVTIRRDIRYLDDQRHIVRGYGTVRPIDYSENLLELYRTLIARYAAAMLEDGDVIFINSSNTALQMLRYIGKKSITVITNNAKAINFDIDNSARLILTGGELNIPKLTFFGDTALSSIMSFKACKCFLGCSGLTANMGMTTENEHEMVINRLMAERTTGEVFVIADHTRLGKDMQYLSLCSGDINNVITDELADTTVTDAFMLTGTKLHIVRR